MQNALLASASNQDPSLHTLLSAFSSGVHKALHNTLMGLYVTGSLLMNDFVAATSDLDFLAVTDAPLSGPEVERIIVLHGELRELNPWGDRLEGGYATRSALRSWGILGTIVAIEPGAGAHAGIPSNYSADNMLALRDYSATLYGPPPQEVLPPVDRATFVAGLSAYLSELAIKSGAGHIVITEIASWILNIARCLYGMHTGRPCTKTEAANWLMRTVSTLEPILRAALVVRQGVINAELDCVLRTGLVTVQGVARHWPLSSQDQVSCVLS